MMVYMKARYYLIGGTGAARLWLGVAWHDFTALET